MKEHIYRIENLGCANCAAKMEEKIRKLPGVEKASITFATRQLRLEARNPESLLPQIQKIVSSIEHDARVAADDGQHHHTEHCERGHDHHEHSHPHKKNKLLPILLGAGLFAGGLIIQLFHFDWAAKAVFLLAYGLLGFEVLSSAVKNLSKGQFFDENFLMSIATVGAFFINEFPEAVGVMLFYRVGEYFEHRAVERSRSQIMEAVDLRPETVNLLIGEEIRIIPASEAKIGDSVLVRPGDRIPLDGTVISGESHIDTAPITGEPVPVSVTSGNAVTSGCVNLSGPLTIRVEQPLSDSMVTKILDFVEEAAAGKPRIDRFITRFARIYTPFVVFGAAAVAIIPSLFTGNWGYWVYTALSFLVMSCPCALVLSVPLAFFSGIGAGSKKGILFKGGAVIETLAQIKAVVLDKTGTVTKGDFSVQKIQGPDDLLALCASCEQASTHPIAQSIVAAAKERGLALETPESLEEIAGHGIRSTLGGAEVLCGNRKLMARYSIELQATEENLLGTRVYVAKNGTFYGYLQISDTLKPEAAAAITQLKTMGIRTAMLTGDQADSADIVASKLGIEEVHAQLLPQEKLERLKAIRTKYGSAMFVGDGINDAPVLSGADVGAAMGSGADAAVEAADVVFLTSQVSAVGEAISIARQTRRIATGNVLFALAVKALVMVLGLFGYASMWAAVFADSGVAMLCVLNAIRMLYGRKQ